MKKISLVLIMIIFAINTSAAQEDARKSAELYVNFAEDVLDVNNKSEKSVNEAISSLERAVSIDETYGEAYYILGTIILIKIDYVEWNAKVMRRRGYDDASFNIHLRKLYKKSKDALIKAALYGEECDEVENLIRILNFELIGPRVPRRIIGIKMMQNK